MTDPGAPGGATFAWSAHPARQHLGKAALGTGLVLALAAASAVAMAHWWWGVVAALVLLAALNRFFFPSRFEIDREGIVATFPLRRQRLLWSQARRFVCGREGGWLSTRIRDSRMDVGGLQVLFGVEREQVIERIRERVPEGSSR